MPNHSVARLDDTGSHDGADRGTIATSAKRTYLNHSLPARVGDTYVCPKHGANAIRTGSDKVWVESRRLAARRFEDLVRRLPPAHEPRQRVRYLHADAPPPPGPACLDLLSGVRLGP